jgi:hypothetical protein
MTMSPLGHKQSAIWAYACGPTLHSQAQAVVAPDFIDKSGHDFINALYSNAELKGELGMVARVFQFEKSTCFAIIISTNAIDSGSGRTGQKLAIGFGVSDYGLLAYPELISRLMHVMVSELNKEFGPRLFFEGAKAIVDSLQSYSRERPSPNDGEGAVNTIDKLSRIQEKLDFACEILQATHRLTTYSRISNRVARLSRTVLGKRKKAPSVIIFFSHVQDGQYLACFDALVADVLGRFTRLSAMAIPEELKRGLPGATRVVTLATVSGEVRFKKSKFCKLGKGQALSLFD